MKKYEIIKDGSWNRIRALRDFQVQDRFVQAGDLGGIVFDGNTLSQEGSAWIFSGNLNQMGIRVGGDAIVDMLSDSAVSGVARPRVTIDGTSQIIGQMSFESESGSFGFDNVTQWEQGTYNAVVGQMPVKENSVSVVRTPSMQWVGGAGSITMTNELFKCGVYFLDADGKYILGAGFNGGASANLSIPASTGSILLNLSKIAGGLITPAEAATAGVTVLTARDCELSIRNSRLATTYTSVPSSVNNWVKVKPNGTNTSFNRSTIVNSTVELNASGTSLASAYFYCDIADSVCSFLVNGVTSSIIGEIKNVGNFMATTGGVGWIRTSQTRDVIRFQDCKDVLYTPAVFPISTIDDITVNITERYLKFTRCNIPVGLFYPNPISQYGYNKYQDIDFSLAYADLGKTIGGAADVFLTSSDVNGMYRVAKNGASPILGLLVESITSVINMSAASFTSGMTPATQNTIIYKDAWLSGLFNIEGTNVFGGSYGHDMVDEVDISAFNLEQGGYGTTGGVDINTLKTTSAKYVRTALNARLGADSLLIASVPSAYIVTGIILNTKDIINATTVRDASTGAISSGTSAQYLPSFRIMISRVDGADLTVDEVRKLGLKFRIRHGCKIVNTSSTRNLIKGNVRIDGDAYVVNSNLTGTVVLADNAVMSDANVNGVAYMKDNAVFTPTTSGNPVIYRLVMKDNALYTGGLASTAFNFTMRDNAQVTTTNAITTTGVVEIQDNARVINTGSVNAKGLVTLKDNATIYAGNLVGQGNITVCGKYYQTTTVTLTGDRVISDVNAPIYDDKVPYKYDF